MSIVVATHKANRIVLAADTQSTVYGYERQPPTNHCASKLIRVGDEWIAVTGRMTYCDVLSITDPPQGGLRDCSRIMKFFLQVWYSMVEDMKLVPAPVALDDGFVDSGLQCIVVADRIYEVGVDFRVRQMAQYCAIGSGSEYAYGALSILYDTVNDPSEIARRAVQTAITFDVKCGGEIEIIEVEV